MDFSKRWVVKAQQQSIRRNESGDRQHCHSAACREGRVATYIEAAQCQGQNLSDGAYQLCFSMSGGLTSGS